MKKSLFTVAVIFCVLMTGCAKSNSKSINTTDEITTTKEDTKVMSEQNYVEKNIAKKAITVDCPAEAKDTRSDVQYGTVTHVTYYSNTCKTERPFNILLPASYDGEKKFPVIYFQHGIFGDENCMIHDGNNKFKEITANLAADGFAKEVIMVFGHMYASDDPSLKPGFSSKETAPYDNFINELVNDLMPYVESHYSVLTGRENTAICGFSMGGRESLYIGLQRSDLFGYIGAIAPAPGLVPAQDWAMKHDGMYPSEADMKFAEGNPLPELLLVCCGTNDGTVGQFPKSYHRILEANNINHIWFEVMGADHNSDAIRSGFFQFMAQVFNK